MVKFTTGTLMVLLLSCLSARAQVIVNADGTHSVMTGNVIVNPNGTHSIISENLIVNPNSSHSVIIGNVIVGAHGKHSVIHGIVIVNSDGSHTISPATFALKQFSWPGLIFGASSVYCALFNDSIKQGWQKSSY